MKTSSGQVVTVDTTGALELGVCWLWIAGRVPRTRRAGLHLQRLAASGFALRRHPNWSSDRPADTRGIRSPGPGSVAADQPRWLFAGAEALRYRPRAHCPPRFRCPGT